MRRTLLSIALVLPGCARSSPPGADPAKVRGVPLASNIRCASIDCRTYNVEPAIRARSEYGIECMGDTAPGRTPNPIPPPFSYLVADAGKPGVPELDARQLAMLERIRRVVHSKTLRFAWVQYHLPAGDPIVFDASDGPCTVDLGYSVLDGACNEYYKPGENPYGVFAAPGDGACHRATPRPWMTGVRRRHDDAVRVARRDRSRQDATGSGVT